ncbi:MAG: hypothetical protein UCO57_14125 [Gemmiger sp.]|uniref:hypothetical protein n=1 Tax=Gemmiger sp. TaxID=2049027 RepID=UPI002E795BE6|nr:hypothetical protein [Gemmiger sp.]MEE0709900.1 hypothetical protein [Gemmiger sp.]
MPQADGSIIIDTRINNKGAEADLKALQAKAKSTAQQISALDKELGQATSKRSKLADDLAAARQQAEGTAKELRHIDNELQAAKAQIAAFDGAQLQEQFKNARVELQKIQGEMLSNANALEEKSDIYYKRIARKHPNVPIHAINQAADFSARSKNPELAAKESALSQQYALQSAKVDQLSNSVRALNAVRAQASGLVGKKSALESSITQQSDTVARLTGEYQRQEQTVAGLTQQRAGLVSQLGQEKKAVDQATASYDRQQKKQAQNSPARQINTASKAMSRFGGRMREIVSGALLFNIISSGLSALVGWIGSALQSTSAFGQALRNLQGAASVAAAPLIDALGNALAYVINLLATAMSYLARFISMLTGKSLSAMKTSAKAMNSYGSAAGNAAKGTEKATRSLAGFDEITRLDAPQEGTSGGGSSAGPNYDFVDQTGAGFSGLLDMVKSFWDTFKAALSPSIAAWSAAWEQIKATALAVWPQIQAAASGLWTNALQPLLSYLVGTFWPGVINAFSQAFAPIVGGTVSTAIQVFADYFVWACGIMTDAINNILQPALEVVLQIWQDMMAGIQNAWNTYGQPIMDGVVAAFRNLETIFSTLYYTVVEPILSNLIDLLQKLWNEHLKQLWDDLLLLFGSVQNTILTFWNSVLSPLINWLIASFGPVFSDVFNAVAGLVETAIGLMADAIDIILVVLRGLLDFLSAVFLGDWGAAWNAIADTALAVWDRIKSGIKSAVNGIIGFINGMIQAAVNGLNRVIDAINTLSFDVPDWVPGIGGSTLGFNFGTITAPQIPYLAQGAVIPPNREFMAVLGDQSHGTNVEAPLATIQQAVAAVMQDYQDGNLAALEQVIAVLRQILEAVYGIHIGDAMIGQAVARYNSRQAIITGRA